MSKMFLVCLLLSFGSLTYSDAPVLLHLSLEPESTLPGIPVSLTLTASNQSQARTLLPDAILLKVIQQNGASFFAVWGSEGRQLGILPQEPTHELLPGQTKTFIFPINAMLSEPDPFGFDTRLSLPGKYQLQVILDPRPDQSLAGDASPSDSPVPIGYPENQIYSNAVNLTIEEPHGEDGLVWARMQEWSKGRGWASHEWLGAFGLAKEIWENHFTSNYVPYIAIIVPKEREDDRLAIYEQVISMYPHHRMLEWLHFASARIAEGQSSYRLAKYDDEKGAKEAHEKAQSHLAEVLKITRNAKLKLEASQMRSRWEDILRMHAEEKKRQQGQ